jgi:hypothetical protein
MQGSHHSNIHRTSHITRVRVFVGGSVVRKCVLNQLG